MDLPCHMCMCHRAGRIKGTAERSVTSPVMMRLFLAAQPCEKIPFLQKLLGPVMRMLLEEQQVKHDGQDRKFSFKIFLRLHP